MSDQTLGEMMDIIRHHAQAMHAAQYEQRACLIDNIRAVDEAIEERSLDKLTMIAQLYRKQLSKQLSGVGQ